MIYFILSVKMLVVICLVNTSIWRAHSS